jgi:cytochrome c-type biogenesis protein CcmF
MGIALILLGALISNVEKQVISRNMLNVDLGKDFPNNENILLYQGDTLAMGEYYVSYKGKEKEGVNLFYEIEYFKANHGTGKMEKQFSLKPIVQLNQRMGNVSEPSTHRFLSRDIYTHITYAELDEGKAKADEEGYKEAKPHMMKVGDTIVASNSMYTFYELDKNIDKKSFELNEDDLAVGAKIKVTDVNRKEYFVEPVFVLRGSTPFTLFAEVEQLGLKFGFTKIDPESGKMEISVAEKQSNTRDFVIMKAIIFPQINLLWTGCILMFIGTWVAIRKRLIESKKS